MNQLKGLRRLSKGKKHILVISQYFYPEQFRINDICVEWVKRGYKVTVVTGIPNYPYGKFFSGYGYTKKRSELWNGIRIVRIPIIPRGKSIFGLIANYFSFVISGYIWQLLTKIQADYVFTFEVSPMTQALIGVWYSKRRKVPNYLYVQDLWPENIEIVTGMRNRFIINLIDKMVKYIYENNDKILGTSPSFVEEIKKKCSDKEKVIYWPQYAEEFYVPIKRDEAINKVSLIPNDNSFKVVFTGNIGNAQGLEILPKVAESIKDINIKFVIIGDGRYKDKLIFEIKKRNLSDKFILIGQQPTHIIPYMLACCDVAFVSFMKDELFTKTIPAKLQSYMSCGMPIVASATGETERIINEAECGYCSAIGNVQDLKVNIMKMTTITNEERKEMGKRAKEYSNKFFNKDVLLEKLCEYF